MACTRRSWTFHPSKPFCSRFRLSEFPLTFCKQAHNYSLTVILIHLILLKNIFISSLRIVMHKVYQSYYLFPFPPHSKFYCIQLIQPHPNFIPLPF